MDGPSLRVSDADREQTVILLREHLLAGRLTLEEFSERIEAALNAGVRRESRSSATSPSGGRMSAPRTRRPFTFAQLAVLRRSTYGGGRQKGWGACATRPPG